MVPRNLKGGGGAQFCLLRHSHQRWARYSIFELIDVVTRYFEEVLTRYRYSHRRYKYLDTISGKNQLKKNWFTNELKKLLQVRTLRTIAKRKNYAYFFNFVAYLYSYHEKAITALYELA